MIEIIDKKKCCGCGACVNVCPKRCIKLKPDFEGFLYPKVDIVSCINCGQCEHACPIINKKRLLSDECQQVFAALNTEFSARIGSSSGGIFSALATYIIACGGVVFGAAMSKDCKSVHHICVDNMEELSLLYGSKYVQSITVDVYDCVKEYLNCGTKILFSGTPCQISGLKLYLKKEYNNLYTIDLICHGVPSQALWANYINSIEQKYNKTADTVNFRSKKFNWKSFTIFRILKKHYYKLSDLDPYMYMFLNNYCLRPSCYNCQFKGISRSSDITLGDFWGIDEMEPDMNDGKGVSAVIINSSKGKKLLENINAESIYYKQVDFRIFYEVFKKNNCSMFESPKIPVERETFYYELNSMQFKEFINKYAKLSFIRKKRIILAFIKKQIKIIVRKYLWGKQLHIGNLSYGIFIKMK